MILSNVAGITSGTGASATSGITSTSPGHSVGICYEGGLDRNRQPCDTRTLEQKASLLALIRELKKLFPNALVVGHRDLNPMKACPCFDAVAEYR